MISHDIGAESNIASSTSPEEKGLAIALEADAHDSGWKDWSAQATMILENRQGQSSKRTMRMQALEQQEEGDKRLIVFNEPRDVKGTAFLVFTKKDGNDDQWLYLPALRRVKRIASKNQSGPFVGSEFAYEDLSSQEVEKYKHRYLLDETFSGKECYVIERVPLDKNSGYTKQILWLDKEEFRQYKVEYYDRKKSLLKTFTANGYRSYGENYWRADQFEMLNHLTGKSTTLNWNEYVFTQGLEDRMFHQNALKKIR
jgi:outer membrane lipoprotein-sorting protein